MAEARQWLFKRMFFLAALPAVIAAARRVAELEKNIPLDRLASELRASRVRPLPSWLARPTWMAVTVEQLLPWLPPRDLGLCLRRSLILLELWSRCGLEPRLHVGLKAPPDLRQGHAWLTALDASGKQLGVAAPVDFVAAFEF